MAKVSLNMLNKTTFYHKSVKDFTCTCNAFQCCGDNTIQCRKVTLLFPSCILWNTQLMTRICLGSVPVDFLRPKFRVVHTKDDVISILMHKYTYTNMYIIKKVIFCRFILC